MVHEQPITLQSIHLIIQPTLQLPLAFDKPLPLLEDPNNHLKHQKIIESMWKKMVVLKNVDSYLNDVKKINDFNIYYEKHIEREQVNQKAQWFINAIVICALIIAIFVNIPLHIFVIAIIFLLMITIFIELSFFEKRKYSIDRLMNQEMPNFYSLSNECQAIAKINSASKLINEHVVPQQHIKNQEQLRINQQKLIKETLKYHWRHWITYAIPFWKTKQKKKINKLLHNCYNLLHQLSDNQLNGEIIQQLYGLSINMTQAPAERVAKLDLNVDQVCLLLNIQFKQKQIENIIHSIGITIVNQQDIIIDDIEEVNPIINQIQHSVNHIHQMLKSNPNIYIPQIIEINQNTTSAFLNKVLNELQQIENNLSATIINNILQSHIILNSNKNVRL